MEYKQEGAKDGEKGHRAAKLLERVQGRDGGTRRKAEKPISQIMVDLGVSESVLRWWMRQRGEAAQGGLPHFSGHGRPRDGELARLRKENKVLREANEIRKKADKL
jgi:transposase-like protein